MNDLILFHSIVYGYSPVQLPDYFVSCPHGYLNPDTTGRYFQRSTRFASSFDNLMFKSKIVPKIDAFREDFFYRTVELWNSLPVVLRQIESKDNFKIILKEHLWILAAENFN